MSISTWNQTYMTIAYAISSRSPDTSTHVGSVIIAPDNTIRSVGYNGLPRGIESLGIELDDGTMSRMSRIDGEKYDWMVHAEKNAIYNAHRNGVSVLGCKLYVNIKPCIPCLHGIIQTGIAEVIFHKQGQDNFDHSCENRNVDWHPKKQTELDLFSESGVKLTCYDGPLVELGGFYSGKHYPL